MNAPFPYFGGKSRLAGAIISRLPKHKTYAEVFGGAAWILFKKEPSTLEVLNDLDRHLMNFYRVAKFHQSALAEEIVKLQPSRELFYQMRDELERPSLTDLQRAAYYYYIQRYAFAGRPGRPTIATSYGRPLQCRASITRRMIPLVSERLAQVMLENLSFEKFIKLYDSPETFFFVDPPYLGHYEYRHNLKPEGFNLLTEMLQGIKGKFLLTHTDQPEIRKLLAGFKFEEIEIAYTAQRMSGGKSGRMGHEVLVTNY